MRKLSKLIALTAIASWLSAFMISVSWAADRVALVIGNGKYTNAGHLKNPTNDASDVAAALRELNFKVILGTDNNYQEMRKLIQDFSKEVANAEVATFYYAGHGISVGGENYHLPIDAKLNSKSDLDFQALSLSLIQRQMEQSASHSADLFGCLPQQPANAELDVGFAEFDDGWTFHSKRQI